MLCVRAVSKAMSTQEPAQHQGRHGERSLGRGSIINIGSATSYVAGPNMMAYVASKHAVIGITKTAGKHPFELFFWSLFCWIFNGELEG